jgi:peptidoglycan/xylan/chitin deacetylase (PgdA/CDA1 family)
VHFYVSGYDTEAIYPWWEFSRGPAGRSRSYHELVSYEGERLRECIDGVRAVAEVHLRHQAPASFYLVGELVKAAANELREILSDPLLDVESHTLTHPGLSGIRADGAALRREVVDSKRLIEDTFGKSVLGLTAPGGHVFGFEGEGQILDVVWEAGYRFVRAAAAGPGGSVPAPLHQPFWYTRDGYPDLLEMPNHAWHDNILTGQPGFSSWPPVIPWGFPHKVAETGREVYEAFAPGLDYLVENNLVTYSPAFHPWSIYRVSPTAEQIDLLLTHAHSVGARPCSSRQAYEHIAANRTVAAEQPPWVEAVAVVS